MSVVAELVASARAKGIHLWQHEGNLRVRAPKGALTEELQRQLTAQKLEIIGFLQQLGRAEGLSQIERVDRAAVPDWPLSYAQERLWFLDQLAPGNAVYNCPGAVRIGGSLDVEGLEAALQRIIARHEALRTIFPSEAGEPRQRILQQVPFRLERFDFSACEDRAQREMHVRDCCEREAMRAFDLARGPLMRGRVMRLAADEHVLLLNLHHIIADGWSSGVLVRELSAEMRGEELEPLPIQYVDYAVWQRRWLQESGELARQLAYWQTKLADMPESLDLPSDRRRPGASEVSGARRMFRFDAALSGRLKTLAESRGCTLYMLMLACVKALLYRYTGQEDICVGSPIANRRQGQTEGLIGFFVNTLALRSRVRGESAFSEYLAEVRRTSLEAYEHQDAPFAKVVEAVHARRELAAQPLFHVMVVMQNAEGGVGGGNVRPYPLANGVAKFDLTLQFSDSEQGLVGSIEYRTALYERSTVERMEGHLLRLCEAIVAQPHTRIDELEYLGAAERRQVLVDFNATEVLRGRERCIHEVFEVQAGRSPDAIAVEHGGMRLTYAQLNARANQLAHYLTGQGVTAEQIVGICLERGLEMVVALLGVLKAGGACLPLDPSYPRERLRCMLEDAAPRIILTETVLAGVLPAGPARMLALDAKLGQIVREVAANRAPVELGLSSESLVYVIYTSGSTGRPKGTAMRHRSLVNLINWHRRTLGSTEGQKVLQFAALGFDVAFQEIFSTLCTGGALVLLDEWVRRDPRALIELLGSQSITRLFVPPLMLQNLAEYAQSATAIPQTLQEVITAGEQLRVSPEIKELFKRLGGCRLHNHYGPTETHVVTALTLAEDPEEWPAVPSIGRPIDDIRVYVLDRHLQPTPIGVVGEIYISGAGVARGYLNRPELTAERFLSDPFSGEPQARMYKTGDLGRWRTDGTIDYQGRNDEQVKIRGFRIELGEIVAQLLHHREIREAVVLALEDESGQKRLVGYVVPREGAAPLSAESLRQHLKETLPEHMVPNAFVMLDALPLSPNGKLDRRALSAPDQSAYSRREYEPPAGEVEELLAGIWQDLLKVERVGRNDNFFELGGHSLLATRLVSKIRGLLGVELPLTAVFEHASLAEQARAAVRATQSRAPPIEPVERAGVRDWPLSYAQERLWFLDQLSPDNAVYNCPGAVRIGGKLDAERLEAALQRIMDRHEVLRTVFPSEAGEPRQRILQQMPFRLERLDFRACEDPLQRERQVRECCGREVRRPFDLARGPLMRAQLMTLTDDEHVLLLNLHHIVTDGWSSGVLVRELTAAMRGEALEPLPIQYVDYAVWQRRWLQESGELARQLGYWQHRLADMPERLDLPSARRRPGVLEVSGARRAFRFDDSLSTRLKTLAETHGCTLYMLMLASVKALLYRYTGQEDIRVGSPIANRRQGQTEELVGFFVNTLVLRSWVRGESAFSAYLDEVRRMCLEAYEHQDAPFEKVVDAVRPRRELAAQPLFQVMVVMQNMEAGVAEENVHPYPLVSGMAKFELTLHFSNSEQGLIGSIEYRTALYEHSTIERMAGHLLRLCEAIVARPHARIDELEYLGPAERQVLVDFNATQRPHGKEELVHLSFERQAQRTPTAVAVTCENESLTYAELNTRANQLARYLAECGVGPEQRVGICMERSLEMMVALLGTMKAGGAYMPLDPSYPTERLAYMVADAAPVMVLTQQRLRGRLPATDAKVITVDEGWSGIAGDSAGNPAAEQIGLCLDHLAYVIYTSGSTGRPKGVMVAHRNLHNLVHWHIAAFALQAECRCSALAAFGFDAAVWEVWPPLTVGATLVLAPPTLAGDVDEMISWWQKQPFDISFMPTPLAELAFANGAQHPKLRTLLVGGDRLRQRVRGQPFAWTNNYGPTECTVVSTSGRILDEEEVLHIGRPISNTQIYILDRLHQRVPIGVRGEICIGGAGVARGYLRRPGLTAERFVCDPFSADSKGRMYRTGDLGRWRADGTIEYLGRNDEQVKIRGCRIEVGEIELQLSRHERIAECAVVAQERDRRLQLVAFYRPHGPEPSADDLRTHLQRSLPAYMIPAAFARLEAMPLTSNGKVDRRTLERMQVVARSSCQYAAPSTDVERELADIWAETLNLDARTIGLDDSFFELGGHSLLAIQLLARIARRFGKRLPLTTLITAPDLRGLARVLEHSRVMAREILVPIQARGSAAPIFAVPGIGGHVISFEPLSRALGEDQPFHGLQAPGLDGDRAPYCSVKEAAESNILAIRAVQPSGPYRLLGHSYGGVVIHEMARRLLDGGESIQLLALLDSAPLAAPEAASPLKGWHDLLDVARYVWVTQGGDLRVDPAASLESPQSLEEGTTLILGALRSAGVEVEPDEWAALTRVFVATMAAYRAHRPTCLSRGLTAILLRAADGGGRPEDLGWTPFFSEPVEVHPVPGSHHSMLRAENVDAVATRIRTLLARIAWDPYRLH